MPGSQSRLLILENAGVLLYGPAWQRALARGLGPFHPDGPLEHLDDRLVRRWAAGQREIPEWVVPALDRLLAEDQTRLEQSLLEVGKLLDVIAASKTEPR